MQSVKAFLFLIRLPNLVIIALAQLLLAGYLIEANFDYKLYTLVTSTVLVGMSGNIINDYFDVRFDHINKPDEIWVGTYFGRRSILTLHLIVSVLAVLTGAVSSIYIGLINMFCVALLWFYSQKLKCVPFLGNFIVAFLTGLVVFIMALKYGYYKADMLVYLFFAFHLNLIREITKDIQDIRGDYFFDCKTIATVNGIAFSKKLLLSLEMVLFGSFVFLSFFPEMKFRIYIWFLLLPLTVLLLIRTWYSHKKKHFKILSRIEKMIILLGILSMFLYAF